MIHSLNLKLYFLLIGLFLIFNLSCEEDLTIADLGGETLTYSLSLTSSVCNPACSEDLIDYNDELGYNFRLEGPLTGKIIASLNYSRSSRHNEWVLDNEWIWQAKNDNLLLPSKDKMYNPFEEFFIELNGYAISDKLNYVIGISSTNDVVDLYTNQYINEFHFFSYEISIDCHFHFLTSSGKNSNHRNLFWASMDS